MEHLFFSLKNAWNVKKICANTMNKNLVKEAVHLKHTAHKRIAHFKKRYKHIAAAFAGAMLMSSALLPGIPFAAAHAAAKSNVGHTRETSAEKMEHENRVNNLEGKKGKVKNSEARNLIRQNMNKMLKAPAQPPAKDNTVKSDPINKPADSPQATREKKADHEVKAKSEKEINPKQVNTPTKEEGKKEKAKPTAPKKADHEVKSKTEKETKPKQDNTSAKEDGKKEQAKSADKKPAEDSVAAKPDTEKKESGNIPDNYEKVLDITATAYAPGPLDNDQWGDKTYLGTTIRPGVVAVDPNVIPLGSRLYVKYPDGHGEYAVAEDTGGAIKGNRIDIAMMDRGDATKFGIKPVKVYVVNTPEK